MKRLWPIPFLLLFLIYLWKVFPDIYWVDSGEFTFHALFLGIPHPTGYPGYLQLLKLFSLFPIGSPYFLINLSSAVFGLLALLLLYKLAFRITGHLPAALFASLSLGLSPVFLSKIEVAEVYTLQILIVLASVYFFLLWLEGRDKRYLLGLSFLLGLGFSHHMSTALVLPVVLLFYLIYNKDLKDSARTLALLLPFFLIGWLPYLFIYFRNDLPAPVNFARAFDIDFNNLPSWTWLWSGEIFKYEMVSTSFKDLVKETGFFGFLLLSDFYYFPTAVGVLGAVDHYRRQRKLFFLLLALFLFLTGFFIFYRIPDIHDFYTISFALYALWIAVGFRRLGELLQSSGSRVLRAAAHSLILFLLLPFIFFLTERGAKTNEFSLEYAHKIFATLPPNSLLCTTYTGGNTLLLLQQLSGIRTDITLFDYGLASLRERYLLAKTHDPFRETFVNIVHKNFRDKMIPRFKAELQKRPVFFSRDEAFLSNLFYREKISEGVHALSLKPPARVLAGLPQGVRRSSLLINQELEFLGFDLPLPVLTEGAIYPIRLYWRPLKPLSQEYIGLLFFLRQGASTIMDDNNFFSEFTLGSEQISPSRWPLQSIVQESFQFSAKPYIRAGTYQVALAVFNQDHFQNTPFKKIKPQFVPIGAVEIREDPSLSHYWDKD